MLASQRSIAVFEDAADGCSEADLYCLGAGAHIGGVLLSQRQGGAFAAGE